MLLLLLFSYAVPKQYAPNRQLYTLISMPGASTTFIQVCGSHAACSKFATIYIDYHARWCDYCCPCAVPKQLASNLQLYTLITMPDAATAFVQLHASQVPCSKFAIIYIDYHARCCNCLCPAARFPSSILNSSKSIH